MKPVPWIIAAVAAYEAYAAGTRRAPTITQLVHRARHHFRPVHCPGCRCKPAPIVPRRRTYRNPAFDPTRRPR